MKLKRLLIAGGNSTLLVWDCPPGKKNNITNKYLGDVEQVGFVEEKNGLLYLNMMGGELCINGTIALASLCGEKGKLFTSGLRGPVFYRNIKDKTFIGLTVNYQQIKNKVFIEGIGYIYLKRKVNNPKTFLISLCLQYNLPAFGIIYFRDNKIIPIVYVKQTDSLFEESACGSGSIAFSILTKKTNITQPTGKRIIVNRKDYSFAVNAQVTNLT